MILDTDTSILDQAVSDMYGEGRDKYLLDRIFEIIESDHPWCLKASFKLHFKDEINYYIPQINSEFKPFDIIKTHRAKVSISIPINRFSWTGLLRRDEPTCQELLLNIYACMEYELLKLGYEFKKHRNFRALEFTIEVL